MVLFISVVAAAQQWGAVPKSNVYKPFTYQRVTKMSDTNQDNTEQSASDTETNTYDFLYELANVDAQVGVMTQTQLAEQLGFSEGVVRAAVRAVSAAIPIGQLKEEGKGKLTARGIKVASAFINRGDTTAEAWVHGLMQAMKSPKHKALTGVVEADTAADIDLGFLGDRAKQVEAQSNALALRGDSELAMLMAKNAELEQRMNDLSLKEVQAAEDAAYQAELDKLTAAMRGKVRAQQAFLKSLEGEGLTPDIG
jgi:hypothetical protein